MAIVAPHTSNWDFIVGVLAARVPIFPVIFDGPGRAIRFLPAFEPSGDYGADLSRLQALYAGVRGIKP